MELSIGINPSKIAEMLIEDIYQINNIDNEVRDTIHFKESIIKKYKDIDALIFNNNEYLDTFDSLNEIKIKLSIALMNLLSENDTKINNNGKIEINNSIVNIINININNDNNNGDDEVEKQIRRAINELNRPENSYLKNEGEKVLYISQNIYQSPENDQNKLSKILDLWNMIKDSTELQYILINVFFAIMNTLETISEPFRAFFRALLTFLGL